MGFHLAFKGLNLTFRTGIHLATLVYSFISGHHPFTKKVSSSKVMRKTKTRWKSDQYSDPQYNNLQTFRGLHRPVGATKLENACGFWLKLFLHIWQFQTPNGQVLCGVQRSNFYGFIPTFFVGLVTQDFGQGYVMMPCQNSWYSSRL